LPFFIDHCSGGALPEGTINQSGQAFNLALGFGQLAGQAGAFGIRIDQAGQRQIDFDARDDQGNSIMRFFSQICDQLEASVWMAEA
jgi:hypothetical protein